MYLHVLRTTPNSINASHRSCFVRSTATKSSQLRLRSKVDQPRQNIFGGVRHSPLADSHAALVHGLKAVPTPVTPECHVLVYRRSHHGGFELLSLEKLLFFLLRERAVKHRSVMKLRTSGEW
jgi:hypothetical protein